MPFWPKARWSAMSDCCFHNSHTRPRLCFSGLSTLPGDELPKNLFAVVYGFSRIDSPVPPSPQLPPSIEMDRPCGSAAAEILPSRTGARVLALRNDPQRKVPIGPHRRPLTLGVAKSPWRREKSLALRKRTAVKASLTLSLIHISEPTRLGMI